MIFGIWEENRLEVRSIGRLLMPRVARDVGTRFVGVRMMMKSLNGDQNIHLLVEENKPVTESSEHSMGKTTPAQ